MATEETVTTTSPSNLLRDTVARLSLLVRLEKKILAITGAYALTIGLFSLIVPLTVQEIVNTFAFAIQPIMIVTLSGIMALTLVAIGAFRVLQLRAVEILVQRLYARIALGLTQQLPRFREESFAPKYVNYFSEAEFLPRSIVAMLVDVMNVFVGGAIGMSILVLYHPYFLAYNVLLVGGFLLVIVSLGQGGFKITRTVSQLHYETMNWLQDIGHNLLHFKATNSTPLLLQKTDELVKAYVMARKTRGNILTGTQYKGAVLFQAFGHSGLIATSGWLLAMGQITLGQFVASEVIVGTLIINMDLVARRMYAIYYVFTSLDELNTLFNLPKDTEQGKLTVSLPDPTLHGVRITCKEVSFAYPDSPQVFENFNLEVAPGEKVAIFSNSTSGKTTLARVLAGLYRPTGGVIRYNGVDLRDLNMEAINACRGLILDSQLSLFEGTLEDNITLGRPGVEYTDIQWALRFVEMAEEVDAMPMGLKSPVMARGKNFTSSQILRLLVARAVAVRPQLLILDGTLHSMQPTTREIILRRICSKEEPWSVVFVSNDPSLKAHVDRRLVLD
ncbi:MAG: ATP-binding cassette domain-containing protein [Nitrospirae bacterium]|nr:ATP-binding cassette domain-containing protein [Nitrospirota bacterium]